jgi:hypothetical protein
MDHFELWEIFLAQPGDSQGVIAAGIFDDENL